MSTKKPRSFECPNCGAEVAANARACRECGSDANTGWKDGDELDYQSVEIPDGYGGEFDAKPARSALLSPRAVAIVALIVAVAFILAVLLRWA
jgi:uncharacterized membrane protein YvbJ